MTDKSEFSSRLTSLMSRLGLSDEQGADYFGVPVTTFRKWLAEGENKRSPNSSAIRLLEVFETLSSLAPAINNFFIKR